MRRVASVVLLAVAGVMLPVVVLATWAESTLYDSESFSERAVEPLNSQAVRTELARRLTAQLVQAGNQQATDFRPAFELALEGVIDTDTFKSIFRNAVRRTHEAIIEQGDGGGRKVSTSAPRSLSSPAASRPAPEGVGPRRARMAWTTASATSPARSTTSASGTPRAPSARSPRRPSSSGWLPPSAASCSPRTVDERCAASASRP